jgi:hypothetical protein
MELYSREYYAHLVAHGQPIEYGTNSVNSTFAFDHHSWVPYSFQPLVKQLLTS